jgi:serine/threonine protein kinase
MSAIKTSCPPEAVLSDFGLGKLDAASAETVSRHIETCADCRQRVAGVSGDSFVGRLRQAGVAAQPKRERTYVPGESLANAANSTDGSSLREDGLPRPSRTVGEPPKHDGPGGPPSLSAPPELQNHPDYELIKELGQGGMGTVYLAKNRMMDRMEVLKVISKSLLDRPGALERFQQEIRSAAKLAHPNIVAAYSVLRPGDLLVFAMEYVKGQDLSEVVTRRGPLPVANAAFYTHQVALGLQHAHEKGMVHRDIKPNNLMLAVEGKKHVVKILDFGLAKATSEKGEQAGLTKSGQMLGTPDYVAPEQTLDAHKADIRADIYSLGCTLYFLLSGGPPFQDQSLFEILKAHHERDPKPLNLVRPDVPVELAAVVAKMMAKRPEDRYQTPGEIAKALLVFIRSGQTIPTAPGPDPAPPQATMPTTHGFTDTQPNVVMMRGHTPIPVPAGIGPPMAAPVRAEATAPGVVVETRSHSPRARRRKNSGVRQAWLATAAVAAVASTIVGYIIVSNNSIEGVARVTPRAETRLADKPRSPPSAKSRKPVDVNGAEKSKLGDETSFAPTTNAQPGEGFNSPQPSFSEAVRDSTAADDRADSTRPSVENQQEPAKTTVTTKDPEPPASVPASPPAHSEPADQASDDGKHLESPTPETPSKTPNSQNSTARTNRTAPPKKPPGGTSKKNPRSGTTNYLSELTMESVMVRGVKGLPVNITGFGVRGNNGAAMNVAGNPTPHGIWAPPLTNGISSVVYDLRKKAASLTVEVGIEDAADNFLATRPVFQIYGDRRLLWASQAITRKGYTERCDNLKVEGVKTLELRVICAGDSRGTGTVWVEPQITWK